MTLALNRRVWVLAERLYIHSYNPDEFLKLLRQHDIDYPGDKYVEFNTTKGRYTFMSQDDFTFASFMDLIPSYKYLPLLQDIAFDPKVESTASDNWNYYGEYIRHWYPNLLDLLQLSGVQVNRETKHLEYPDLEEPPPQQDFLPDGFGDHFLDYIRREINECHRNGLHLAVMFLSRKILETVVVRLFEVVFPKLVNKCYSSENHELWYDARRGRYHGFGILLDNLKLKAAAFHEDEGLIREFVSTVKPFKDETNKCVHYDYKTPDERYINEWRIPKLIGLARRLFRKYCNP
jgi:hypothetical protein